MLLCGAGVGAAILLTRGGKPPAKKAAETTTAGTRSKLPTATTTTTRRPPPKHPLPRITPAVPGTAVVVSHGPPRREIALTFDDGFCRSCVGGILSVLAKTGAHATICPNGRYGPTVWDHFRRQIRHLLRLGQLAICNHTFSHYDSRTLSESALTDELDRNEAWIEQEFGVSARPYFRPPYGSYDSATLAVAGQLGYTRVLLWSGTLADSTPRDIPYLLYAIRYWAKPGAIILAHGNYPATPHGLMKILRYLKQRHLRTVTIPELLAR